MHRPIDSGTSRPVVEILPRSTPLDQCRIARDQSVDIGREARRGAIPVRCERSDHGPLDTDVIEDLNDRCEPCRELVLADRTLPPMADRRGAPARRAVERHSPRRGTRVAAPAFHDRRSHSRPGRDRSSASCVDPPRSPCVRRTRRRRSEALRCGVPGPVGSRDAPGEMIRLVLGGACLVIRDESRPDRELTG